MLGLKTNIESVTCLIIESFLLPFIAIKVT